MKVAVVQHDTVWEDPPANFRKIDALLDSVLGQGPQLVCLQEMCSCGITPDIQKVAEPAEGPTFQFLQSLARRHSMFVQGTMAEVVPGMPKGYNTCLVFDPQGNVLSRYHKIHPFTYGGEDKLYEKGSTLPLFSLGEFTAATPICYDMRFPELFRRAMHQGANLFIVPANWPAARRNHWRALAVARAIENLSWLIAINRVGEGGGQTFPGSSLIVSPLGEIVLDLDEREQAGVAEVDFGALCEARERFRFLQDARADLFPDLFGQPVRT